jgi:hypothetical protein
MKRRLQLSDLRSLERRSMYSIFAPLDPNERLPRELLLESRRYRWLGRRLRPWVAAMLYLPGIMLAVIVLGAMHVDPMVSFTVAGLMLAGFYVYAIMAKH